MRLGMGGCVLLSSLLLVPAVALAVPPGPNGKIVFNCQATPASNGGVTTAICVANADGSGLVRILDAQGVNETPVWSPDGTKIAFASSINGTPHFLGDWGMNIWVMNADGSGLTQLTTTSADSNPAWSPDGRIAFLSFRDLTSYNTVPTSIYVMNADGTGQRRLTAPGGDPWATDLDPAWSPDGQKIVFTHEGFGGVGVNAGYGELYTINADGTGLTQLTAEQSFQPNPYKYHPTWSPDGTLIAFSGWGLFNAGGPTGNLIWVVGADGSGEHPITNNSGVDYYNPAWSPDGTKLVFMCTAPPDASGATAGDAICTVDADGSNLTHVTDQNGSDYPDWGRQASTTISVTDCSDPALSQLTTIPADLVVDHVAGCTAINLGSVQSVGGDVSITGNPDLGSVNLGSVQSVGGDVTVTGSVDLTTVNLGSVHNVGGDVTVSGIVDLGSLDTVGGNVDVTSSGAVDLEGTTVGGNVTITSDGTVTVNGTSAAGTVSITGSGGVVNVGDLVTTSGSVSINGEGTVTVSGTSAAGSVSITGTGGVVNVGDLTTTSGSVSIDSDGAVNVGDLTTGGGSVTITSSDGVVNVGDVTTGGGNVTITSSGVVSVGDSTTVSGSVSITGSGSVSAETGGGTTDVTLLGGSASMRVILPQGAFDQPVPFTIAALPPTTPSPGTDASGEPAAIAPIAAYQFSFAIPTLNQTAQLGFTIDLSTLDDETRAAVLDGIQTDATTIAVQGDAPDATYGALSRCTGTDTPQSSGCVVASLLTADGQPAPDPSSARFLSLTGVVGHFSNWAVVLVEPLDTTAPVVTIVLSAPNGGTPDGQGGWFVTGPVQGSVFADDAATGGSPVTTIDCGPLALSASGLGTTDAHASFTVAADGVSHLSCTAADGAGNTSAPASLAVMIDTHAPALSPAVGPLPVLLHGAAAASANAVDAGSGVASQACSAIDTDSAGPHTATCMATDQAGNAGAAAVSYDVVYSTGECLDEPGHEVLAPVKADGSSRFAWGRTVPIKFRVCDAHGTSIGTPGTVTALTLVETIEEGLVAAVGRVVQPERRHTGFWWDRHHQEWVFTLRTRSLEPGRTYVYDIALNDGTHIPFKFSLKGRPHHSDDRWRDDDRSERHPSESRDRDPHGGDRNPE